MTIRIIMANMEGITEAMIAITKTERITTTQSTIGGYLMKRNTTSIME